MTRSGCTGVQSRALPHERNVKITTHVRRDRRRPGADNFRLRLGERVGLPKPVTHRDGAFLAVTPADAAELAWLDLPQRLERSGQIVTQGADPVCTTAESGTGVVDRHPFAGPLPRPHPGGFPGGTEPPGDGAVDGGIVPECRHPQHGCEPDGEHVVAVPRYALPGPPPVETGPLLGVSAASRSMSVQRRWERSLSLAAVSAGYEGCSAVSFCGSGSGTPPSRAVSVADFSSASRRLRVSRFRSTVSSKLFTVRRFPGDSSASGPHQIYPRVGHAGGSANHPHRRAGHARVARAACTGRAIRVGSHPLTARSRDGGGQAEEANPRILDDMGSRRP